MEPREEYHDPDYAGTSTNVTEDPQSLAEIDRIQKIKTIIRREFANELEARENEISLIDQRASSARHLLHRLRCALVTRFYQDQRLQLNPSQVQDEIAAQTEPRAKAEVSKLVRESQRRLHPSVRKLVGKKTVDLDEIFKYRAPRNKVRKDYCAMVQSRNFTIAADTTRSLRPSDPSSESKRPSVDKPSGSRPKKMPRQNDPKVESAIKLDEVTRNRQKHRYRIIIGNTSKYAPAASSADKSTHKWLLYVRGGAAAGAGGEGGGAGGTRDVIAHLVTGVTVHLHHSYAPHHTVHIDKPPYHVSRRGWGEFPAKVELEFAMPERNRPAVVSHTIKLDRNYTGLQTLGAETIVDVWLYSNQDMLQYEFKEEKTEAEIKQEILEDVPEDPATDLDPGPEDANKQVDSWLDFFNNEPTELDVDEMIIKAVKKECDIENLIDHSVIQKDAIKDIVSDENSVTETLKDDDKLVNSSVKIKSEPQESACDTVEHTNRSVTEDLIENIPSELLNQTNSPKKRIMKYMDPTTGKIYYLEMDRNLDLSKVQEIVINSKGNIKTAKISPIKPNGLKNVRKTAKKGVSLLKPDVKSLLRQENQMQIKEAVNVKLKNSFRHIENDHCYLGNPTFSCREEVLPAEESELEWNDRVAITNVTSEVVEAETPLYERLCESVKRLTCTRVAVSYLLSKMPLVSDAAKDPDFLKHFPFTVEKEGVYWKLDFAKRRNIEWTRAKLINKILHRHCPAETKWRTKQILLFGRVHGYNPARVDSTAANTSSQLDPDTWTSWTHLDTTRRLQDNIKQMSADSGLTIFNPEEFLTGGGGDVIDLTDPQEVEVDVVGDGGEVRGRSRGESAGEKGERLTVPLPVDDVEERARFMWVERVCADIGIDLRNEDVGHGYCYSAVHATLLCALRGFASELLRSALAARLSSAAPHIPLSVWTSVDDDVIPSISPLDLRNALSSHPRLRALTDAGLGRHPHNYTKL